MRKQPQDTTTLSEKIKIVEWLAFFPALSLFVFTRKKVGFRKLKPTNLLGIAMFIWTIQSICDLNIFIFHSVGSAFNAFPWIMLLAGAYQRRQRWVELKAGQCWHTYSSGISYLESIPFMPAFLKDQRRLYRFAEPVLLFIAAMGIGLLFSEALARWIAFSAIATCIYEQSCYDRQLDRDLDVLDSLVSGEAQNEIVKHFTGPQPDEHELTVNQTSGVSTGAAYDIQKQIERLRAKRASTPVVIQ